MCLCRAAAGGASRGEEEDGCGSVRSELAESGRSFHCPEKCAPPVKTPTSKQETFSPVF